MGVAMGSESMATSETVGEAKGKAKARPLWAMGAKAVKRGRGGKAVGGRWRIRQCRQAHPQARPLEEAKSEAVG